jgi:hypothetical protein
MATTHSSGQRSLLPTLDAPAEMKLAPTRFS